MYIKIYDIALGHSEIEKHKCPVWVDEADIDKLLTSNKIFFAKKNFKYFACYKDN